MIYNKKFFIASLLSIFSLSLSGCPSPITSDVSSTEKPIINLEKQNIKVSEKVTVNVSLNKKNSHQYAYRFAADKGSIESTNANNDSKAIYTAPISDGRDTIRVSVFDITDNINLPSSSKEIVINK